MAPAVTLGAPVPQFKLRLPAEPLERALDDFGTQTGTQVLVSPKLVNGLKGRALTGTYTVVAGLTELLRGTNLQFVLGPDGVILIRAAPPSPGGPAEAVPAAGALPKISEEPPTLVTVSGFRPSLIRAQAAKKSSTQIVDIVYATDIGKLPDQNAAEALQRVSGVQIERDEGEGSTVAIRGLSQVRSELDGRSIFTASGGRNLNFEDLPADLLASVEVHKTPTADQIEGGLGGTVDLKLHEPFDFTRPVLSTSVGLTDFDNAGGVRPDLLVLASNRWQTSSGEMGLLFTYSLQQTMFRTDFDVGGSPEARNDLIDLNGNGKVGDAADTIIVPTGGGQAIHSGARNRTGLDAQFQWRPDSNTEIKVDAFTYRYRFDVNGLLLFASSANFGAANPNNITVQPGTNVFQSGTFKDLPLDANAYGGGRVSTTSQLVAEYKHTAGIWLLSGEVAYNNAQSDENFSQLGITTNLPDATTGTSDGALPAVDQDYRYSLPVLDFEGIDLTNPTQLVFSRAITEEIKIHGGETSARLDFKRKFDRGILSAIKFGARFEQRAAGEGETYRYYDLSGIPIASHLDLLQVTDLNLFGRDNRGGDINQIFWAPKLSTVNNFQVIANAFGLSQGADANQPPSYFSVHENTFAVYAMAEFSGQMGSVGFDGNAGVRVISTTTATKGSTSNFTPITQITAVRSSSVSALPQVNIKLKLTPNLDLRLAGYETLTRQDFDQLAPQVALDYLTRDGTEGNPYLAPLRATNFDVSLEYDGARRTQAFVDLFLKRVTGFIQNEVEPQTFFGQGFDIITPENGSSGKIWGAETGFTKFLTFLPMPLDGFAVQANVTYVGSSAPSPISSEHIPLEGLSRLSYNLVAIYERHGISARIAYNWRSPYVLDIASSSVASGGYATDWSAAFGVVDASLSFPLGNNWQGSFQAANLNNARSVSYFSGLQFGQGSARLPHNISQTDRRIGFSIRRTF